MTEEVRDVQLGVEQILAAILNQVGDVIIKQEDLVKDYSQFAVAVDPTEDNLLKFSLIHTEGVDFEQVSE